MKFKIIFLISTFFLLALKSQATDQEESSTLLQQPTINYLAKIPNELIFYIGADLYYTDFRNFVTTSNSIKGALMNHKLLFIPEDLNSVKQTLIDTPLEKTSCLIQAWGRNQKKSVTMLRKLLPDFGGYPSAPQENQLKAESEKVANYVKLINILYALGDKKTEELFKNLYNTVQDILCDEHAQVNQALYIFHLKNLSLLVPKVRKEIAEYYQHGVAPFNVDLQQSEQYLKELGLPLTANIFHTK